MWKLDQDEFYFKIYDSKNQIAGYFDPEYGDIFPKENENEIIEKMYQNHEKIPGGYLMLPLIKFGIYDSDYEGDVSSLKVRISSIYERLQLWENFLLSTQNTNHFVRISHTDQDMLSITIPIRFQRPTPLEKKQILLELNPILDHLHQQNLL